MLFLTAPAAQGDPVALLMVLILAVVVAVMALRKLRLRKQAARKTVPETAAPAPQAPAAAPGSAGKLKLHDVDPKTAAMLMAITADSLGKPLNELRFLSIKEVKK